MNKICSILLLTLFLFHYSNAQNKSISTVVLDSFNARFPNASAVVWNDMFTSCRASFKTGTTEMKATFSGKGNWFRTETKITYDLLPDSVKEGFKKTKYANIPVKDASKTEEKNKPVQYRITVMKGAVNKTGLVFSTEGALVSEKNFL